MWELAKGNALENNHEWIAGLWEVFGISKIVHVVYVMSTLAGMISVVTSRVTSLTCPSFSLRPHNCGISVTVVKTNLFIFPQNVLNCPHSSRWNSELYNKCKVLLQSWKGGSVYKSVLLCKCRILSSDPQHPGYAMNICNSKAGKVKKGRFWRLTGQWGVILAQDRNKQNSKERYLPVLHMRMSRSAHPQL